MLGEVGSHARTRSRSATVSKSRTYSFEREILDLMTFSNELEFASKAFELIIISAITINFTEGYLS